MSPLRSQARPGAARHPHLGARNAGLYGGSKLAGSAIAIASAPFVFNPCRTALSRAGRQPETPAPIRSHRARTRVATLRSLSGVPFHGSASRAAQRSDTRNDACDIRRRLAVANRAQFMLHDRQPERWVVRSDDRETAMQVFRQPPRALEEIADAVISVQEQSDVTKAHDREDLPQPETIPAAEGFVHLPVRSSK